MRRWSLRKVKYKKGLEGNGRARAVCGRLVVSEWRVCEGEERGWKAERDEGEKVWVGR